MNRNSGHYRRDIDGLRAIAVFMVLMVHAFPKKLPNGYVGVDIFFVISGYLITSILLRDFSINNFSIKDFYIRRINRIFPALLLVLVFTMAMGMLVMYPDEYLKMRWAALTSTFFSANINFYLEAGYWDISSKLKPLLHLWSLGVEEQFYLLWPLIVWIIFRKKFSFIVWSLGIIFLSLTINLFLTFENQPAAFYLPFGRLWELAAGGLLAGILHNYSSPIQRGIKNALGWGGIILLIVTQVVPMDANGFPGYYAVIIIISTSFIIFSGPHSWINQYFLSNQVLVYIGKISYPLYLWHWPLLVFARLLGDGRWSIAHRNTAVIASIALAVLTYHAVEKPLAKRVVHRGQLAVVLTILMICFGGLAGLVHWEKMPFAPASYANAKLLNYEIPEIHSSGKIVLLGDSNAGHMVYGLSLLYGERLKHYATPGWPYLDGVGYRPGFVPHSDHVGSPELTKKALEEIEADPDIRLVIISNSYLMYLPGDNLRSISGAATSETVAQAYEAGMYRTAQRLQASGKKILLIKSIPNYPMLATVKACVAEVRPQLRRQPEDCRRSRAVIQSEREEYDGIVQRIAAGLPGVRTFNTLDVLCDAQYCYVERDGILMYIDPGHYTTAGSQLMGAAVAKYIEQILLAKSDVD